MHVQTLRRTTNATNFESSSDWLTRCSSVTLLSDSGFELLSRKHPVKRSALRHSNYSVENSNSTQNGTSVSHSYFQTNSVNRITLCSINLVLELELDVLARQLSVDGGESGELVLDLLLALSTEEHLDVVSVRARDVGVLADALARVHQIVDDGVVHSGQSVSVRTLALELVGTAVVLGQNGSCLLYTSPSPRDTT